MPRTPASIPAGRWRTLWHESIAELEDPGQIEFAMVEQLVLNLISAAAALTEARAKPTVTGSQGQEVEHPGFKAAARCEQRAMAIARELQLTPGARRGTSGSSDDEPRTPFDELDDEVAQARARHQT